MGVVAPVAAPPPFGTLTRAAEFGVKPYNQLSKAIQGTGLQGHHLIEQRFGEFMLGDPRMNLTIAVTDAEHQAFTNAWRQAIPYGANTRKAAPTPDEILNHARGIYAQYPAMLKALGL